MSELAVVGLDDPRWQRLVRTSPDATVFHGSEWISSLATTYGFVPFAVIVDDGRGALAGAPFLAVGRPFRRRWSSLPFTDACAPLGDPASIAYLVDGLEPLAARHDAAAVELRETIRGHAARGSRYVRHSIPLGGAEDELVRRISGAHLRNARRAERGGVEIERGRDAAAFDAFYSLHVRTRRRLGVPVQPRRFFRSLAERVVAPGHGFVLTARLRGRAIASAVYLTSSRTLHYKYGASDEREWAHRPNDLLFRTAILAAKREGFSDLDLGRSDLEDEGLRRFKSEWGGVESELAYTLLGPAGSAARIPGRGLLSALIRNTDPLVCRVVGEALYRYSA